MNIFCAFRSTALVGPLLLLGAIPGGSLTAWAADAEVSFRRQVAPILLDRCVACHGAKKAEGGYRVDTYAELLKAGDSAEPPIAEAPGETSELLRRMTTDEEFERMPAESDALPQEEIDVVARWIAAGAKFDGDKPADPLAFVIPAPRHADPPAHYRVSVPVTALAFAPEAGQVVVGGYHELSVWNPETGDLLRRIPNLGQRIYATALSPDRSTLAVACGEPGRSGEVRLVDWQSGEVQAVVGRAAAVVLDVAFRPNSNQLAIAAADHTVRIIDRETLKVVQTLASHADWVTAVAWSDDGKRLASASRDKTAKVFDAETGELVTSYKGHAAAVTDVAFLPGANHLISVGGDKKLHRWQASDGKKVAEVPLGGEGHALTQGEGVVWVACSEGRLVAIDLGKNQVSQELKGHRDWVLSAASHPQQARLVSGGFDGEVRFWNAEDGQLIQSWLAKP